jgi:HAMP domain-containing protein
MSNGANTDELKDVLRPIESLISKSEKAERKLAQGTWQHTMLRENLKALRIASALLKKETDDTHSFTRDNLEEALRAFASMIDKTEKAQAKLSSGTPQHTLQQNRLKALRVSEALIKLKLA